MYKSGHTLSKVLSVLAAGLFTFGMVPHGAAQTLAPELDPIGPVTIFAGGAATSPATGVACGTAATPVATDDYGDGCLATQVALPSTRYVVQDKNGNFFFSDYTNNLVRRIDGTTGIITLVAGSASTSPASGTACTGGTSADIFGDGCSSVAVALSKPLGLAFAPNGDLYFVDGGHDVIRKIAATSGLIPATGGGVISNIAGHAPTTGSASFGYFVSNASTSVNAATASYIDGPFGIAFDKNGVLYSSEEFKNAIYAINVTSSNQTVYGITLQPGEIWKVVGSLTAGSNGAAGATPVDCTNGTSGTFGCNFGTYTEGGAAGANLLDAPYAVAFDPTGNLYIANEFVPDIPIVTPAGLISTYAGLQTASGTDTTVRATAGTFGFGNSLGVTSDPNGVVYFTDSYSGVVWRVDPDTKTMYVVAGLTGTVAGSPTATICSTGDSVGNGCPALQASFSRSKSSKGNFADTTSPGIFGIAADALGNLYVGDSLSGQIRKIGTGTNFGTNRTTKVFVHYFKGDSPKTGGYTVASTGNIITVSGTPACTAKADTSYDCEVDLTSAPTTAGTYTGTLTVTSTKGLTATVPLSGSFTSLTLTYSAATTCSGTTYSSTTPITLTATVGGGTTGSVQFYDNTIALGSPVTLSGGKATLTQPLAAGNHSITAIYNAGGAAAPVSTTSATLITTADPSFGATVNSTQSSTVKAGGTALYNFVSSSIGYTGTISFFCSGLPAGASCTFTPQTITASGCSSSQTVAMSIFTTQSVPIAAGSLVASGRGPWTMITLFASLGLALGIGLRRRKLGARFGSIGMVLALLLISSSLVACSGSSIVPKGGTPAGTYTVTVTAVGSVAGSAPSGGSQSFTVPLTVN